jgi:uncharacterized membrane protein
MDKKTTGIISYLTIIGWIIAYIAGDKENAKFHLNQSLVIGLGMVLISIIGGALSFIPFMPFVLWAVDVILFVFCIIGIIYAANGQDKALPVVGNIKLLK